MYYKTLRNFSESDFLSSFIWTYVLQDFIVFSCVFWAQARAGLAWPGLAGRAGPGRAPPGPSRAGPGPGILL